MTGRAEHPTAGEGRFSAKEDAAAARKPRGVLRLCACEHGGDTVPHGPEVDKNFPVEEGYEEATGNGLQARSEGGI